MASVAIAAVAFVFLPDCFGEPVRAETSEQLHARLAKLCPPRPETAARFPGDRTHLRQARDLLRFCEDRFVCWEKPANHPGWKAPSVLEQYSCFCPIDASAAKMIRGYLAMYRAEGRAEDLAKARTLANTVTRLQKPSGRIPTFWTGDWAADVRYDWLNCMASGALALRQGHLRQPRRCRLWYNGRKG